MKRTKHDSRTTFSQAQKHKRCQPKKKSFFEDGVNLDRISFVENVNVTSAYGQVYRVHGGRGVSGMSRIYCEKGDLAGGCDPTFSGSMQAKLETISDAISSGVNVIRTGPSDENGYTWRVTFLDDSPCARHP